MRDIAAVAATTLTKAGHEGAAYTLTGPASITHAQIAAALTAALGRDITFIDVPPETFASTLQGILPPLAGPGPAGGLRALPARGGSISLPGGR